MPHDPLILFDGVCNLCSASVRFVIRHDPGKRFRFASLQSPLGRQLSARYDCPDLNSMLLLTDGVLYQRSTAALKILKLLGGAPAMLYVFILVPAPLRDWVYDFIGNRRYRWFGKTDQCWLPKEDISDRFVDGDA